MTFLPGHGEHHAVVLEERREQQAAVLVVGGGVVPGSGGTGPESPSWDWEGGRGPLLPTQTREWGPGTRFQSLLTGEMVLTVSWKHHYREEFLFYFFFFFKISTSTTIQFVRFNGFCRVTLGGPGKRRWPSACPPQIVRSAPQKTNFTRRRIQQKQRLVW